MVMGVPLHHRAMVEGGGDSVELGVRVVTGAAAIEGAHGRGGGGPMAGIIRIRDGGEGNVVPYNGGRPIAP
jgi:hypothetical protein